MLQISAMSRLLVAALMFAATSNAATAASSAQTAQAIVAASGAAAPKADVSKAQAQRLLDGLKPAYKMTAQLAKIKAAMDQLRKPGATKKTQMTALTVALAGTEALDGILRELQKGFEAAGELYDSKEWRALVAEHRAAVEALRARIRAAAKDGQSEDDSPGFDIENLVGLARQTESTASALRRKADETKDGVIQNLR